VWYSNGTTHNIWQSPLCSTAKVAAKAEAERIAEEMRIAKETTKEKLQQMMSEIQQFLSDAILPDLCGPSN
jgi:hypothetical protein